MKNFHKATAFIIGATLIVSSSSMIFGEVKPSNVSNSISSNIDSYIKSEATIKSITNEDGKTNILISPKEENSMDIMLKIQDTTNVDLKSLNEGDDITAVYEKAMTRSIPPQTNAIEISKLNDTNLDMSPVIGVMPEISKATMNGVVSEIKNSETKSILVNDISNKDNSILLNINNDTILIKADGTSINLEDIKFGDKVNIVHSTAITSSLPAQTSAYAVIVNNNDEIAPQYITSKQLETIDGDTIITSDDENFIIRLNKDTKLSKFKTKDIATVSDIKADTNMLIWAKDGIMSLSMPAQIVAEKVVVLPEIAKNEENNNTENKINALNPVKISGIINNISNEDENYKSISISDKENSETVLNIGEETIIINADGMPMNFNDLKENDKINAVHSPIMTFSLPPQTFAYVIIVNNENAVIPEYIVVDDIEKNEDTIKIQNADKSHSIIANKDTQILPYKTKNIVTLDDISKDSIILSWSDKENVANKIMILPIKETTVVSETQQNNNSTALMNLNDNVKDIFYNNKIVINGNILDVEDKKIEILENHYMLPLRLVAEKLGFNLQWDANTFTANLDDGTIKTSITVDKDSYQKSSSQAIGLTQPVSYGIAPKIINGNIYVPSEIFNLLYSNPNTVNILDGTININTK